MTTIRGPHPRRPSTALVCRDDSAPGRCLRDLNDAHELVREATMLKLEVAQSPASTPTHCALVHWKMGRARHQRSKSLAAAVAELLKDASPAEAATLRALQLEELTVSQCCSAHLLRWTAEAIPEDREAYAFAATAFCGAILERLTREGEILFPMLLGRISALPYASKALIREA